MAPRQPCVHVGCLAVTSVPQWGKAEDFVLCGRGAMAMRPWLGLHFAVGAGDAWYRCRVLNRRSESKQSSMEDGALDVQGALVLEAVRS